MAQQSHIISVVQYLIYDTCSVLLLTMQSTLGLKRINSFML
jgi:hypothetical protein